MNNNQRIERIEREIHQQRSDAVLVVLPNMPDDERREIESEAARKGLPVIEIDR